MKFKLPNQLTKNWPGTTILDKYLDYNLIRIIHEYIHEPINLFEHVQISGNNNYITSLPLSLYVNGKHFIEKMYNTTFNVDYFGQGIIYYNNKEQVFAFIITNKFPANSLIPILSDLESDQTNTC